MAIQTKICGLTTPAAVETAIGGGASHIGYIFFAKSPRNISPDDAATLADLARDKVIQTVVTVNADDAFLDEIVEKVRPDLLQLHGSESPERIREIKDRFNLPVMKAFSINGPQDLENVKAYEAVADQFLFDAKPPKGAIFPVAMAFHLTGIYCVISPVLLRICCLVVWMLTMSKKPFRALAPRQSTFHQALKAHPA